MNRRIGIGLSVTLGMGGSAAGCLDRGRRSEVTHFPLALLEVIPRVRVLFRFVPGSILYWSLRVDAGLGLESAQTSSKRRARGRTRLRKSKALSLSMRT